MAFDERGMHLLFYADSADEAESLVRAHEKLHDLRFIIRETEKTYHTKELAGWYHIIAHSYLDATKACLYTYIEVQSTHCIHRFFIQKQEGYFH